MSKKNAIVDAAGIQIKQYAPKIKEAIPLGSQILVELLSPEDILGPQSIHIPDSGKIVQGAPQGYIRAIGPVVKKDDWGFNIGDRVVLQGSFVPLPEAVCQNGRMMSVVEPHVIKARLIEQ
jgi:hypothetical protein